MKEKNCTSRIVKDNPLISIMMWTAIAPFILLFGGVLIGIPILFIVQAWGSNPIHWIIGLFGVWAVLGIYVVIGYTMWEERNNQSFD